MADTGVPVPEDLHVLAYLDALGEETDEQLAFHLPDEPTNIVGDDPDVTILDTTPEEGLT